MKANLATLGSDVTGPSLAVTLLKFDILVLDSNNPNCRLPQMARRISVICALNLRLRDTKRSYDFYRIRG